MNNPISLGVLGHTTGPNASTSPTPKKVKYSFICWRCGTNRHLIIYHGPGGLLRICKRCAVKVGLR